MQHLNYGVIAMKNIIEPTPPVLTVTPLDGQQAKVHFETDKDGSIRIYVLSGKTRFENIVFDSGEY